MSELDSHPLCSDLKALIDETFPKQCHRCATVFKTAEQLKHEASETPSPQTGSSPFETFIDAFVQPYKQCPCGGALSSLGYAPPHTQVGETANIEKRDASPQGVQRRKRFNTMLNTLKTEGWDHHLARLELSKVW